MEQIGYRILAYARSEEVERGVDILVVLRSAVGEGSRLCALLRRDWKTVTAGDEETIEYLEAVFFDIRRYLVETSAQETESFFEVIENLNVGPLRTSASGLVKATEGSSLVGVIDDRSSEILCPPTVMESVINALLEPDNQLQAARIFR